MIRPNPRTIAWIAAIVFLLTGCDQEPRPPQKIAPAKIGIIYPFSGPFADAGEDLKAGLLLAADIVNQVYDLPLPLAREKGIPARQHAAIELVFEDSKNDPALAAEKVENLSKLPDISAVMGCYSSTVTAAASERAEIVKMPFINAASTSPLLTQRGLKWFFRTTPDDDMFSENFFTFFEDLSARQSLDISKRLVLVYENRLWGTSVSRAERREARRHGFQIIDDIPYDAEAERFDDELARIQAAQPAIILQTSYSKDAIALMKGYKARGISPVAVLGMNAGFISPSFIQAMGVDAEFILSREVWAPDIGRKKPLAGSVNALFRERYGRDMTGTSARAFTALLVIAEALNRAGDTSREALRAALLTTDISKDSCIMPWDGIRFDPDTGQNLLGKGIIVQRIDGEYRTVWPFDFSDHPVVWPMPPWNARTISP